MSRILLLMTTLIMITLCGVAMAFDQPAAGVTMTAQDAEGRVWGVAYGSNLRWWDDVIHNWRGLYYTGDVLVEGQGIAQPFNLGGQMGQDGKPVMPYHVMSMQRGGNGVVCCLWGAGEDQPLMVTRHLGSDSRIVGKGPEGVSLEGVRNMRQWGWRMDVLCYMDTKENVWLSPDMRSIYRMNSKGETKMEYALPLTIHKSYENQMSQTSPIPIVYPKMVSIGAVEDTRGRMIFYKSGMPFMPYTMEGVVIHDQSHFKQLLLSPAPEVINQAETPPSLNLPVFEIIKLEPRDEKSAWLLSTTGSLSILDLDSGAVTMAVEPELGAFRNLRALSNISGALFLISDEAFWKETNGAWSHIFNSSSKSMSVEYPGAMRQITLALCPQGIVCPMEMDGFNYIPTGSTEVQIFNWRRGFTLTAVSEAYTLSSGQVLLCGQSGAIQIDPASLALIPPANALPESIPVRAMAQTSDGRIWLLKADNNGVWDGALSEWDGTTWTAHEAPLELERTPQIIILRDSKERIWIASYISANFEDPPVAIYDTVAAAWSKYDSFLKAYESLKSDMKGYIFDNQPLHPFPEFTPDYINPSSGEPFFSGDGKIVVWSNHSMARLYDGSNWTELTLENPEYQGAEVCNVFLTDDGKTAIAVRTRDQQGSHYDTWVNKETGRWEMAPDITSRWPLNALHSALINSSFKKGSFDKSINGVIDNHGVWWSSQQNGKLSRSVYGVLADGFPADFANPFVIPRQISAVYADLSGNTFILTQDEAFIIPPGDLIPDTTLNQTTSASGSVELIAASSTPDVSYVWRVDEEPWGIATKETTFEVSTLKEGKHRIQARAITAMLEFDRTPAEITIEIGVTEADITAWVTSLGIAPYVEREKAVKMLRANPEKAMPTLKAARAAAVDDDVKWWMDAALEGMEADSNEP